MSHMRVEVGEVKGAIQLLVEQLQKQNAVLMELSKAVVKKRMDEPETSENSIGDFHLDESWMLVKKVELTMFEGEDSMAWITRADIYFNIQNTPEDVKLKFAMLSMEGSPIHWFNLLMETENELSGKKLKKVLIARYGGLRLENPFEELSTIRQTGSVEEFVEAFKLLSSQFGCLPEE